MTIISEANEVSPTDSESRLFLPPDLIARRIVTEAVTLAFYKFK